MGKPALAPLLIGFSAALAAAALLLLLAAPRRPEARLPEAALRRRLQSSTLIPWRLRANATACKNRPDIQLDKRIVTSSADCGAACEATSGCTGFGFMSWSACNGWQTDKATCCLWIGKCVGTYDKCWADYTMLSSDGTDEEEPLEPEASSSSGSEIVAEGSSDDVRLHPTDPTTLTGFTLLTSLGTAMRGELDNVALGRLLTASEDPHSTEVFAALAANLRNRHFDEVHVLAQASCSAIIASMKRRAKVLPAKWDVASHLGKLKCAKVLETPTPTYADYFAYSDGVLSGRAIVVAQPDVVFDSTLGRIDRAAILQQKHGYILAVKPPPADGDYKEAFHADCANTPKCAVGAWQGGGPWGQSQLAGSSWDAFVFAPPVTLNMSMTKIAIQADVPGSERLAAFQLETAARISLYNPCEHVHAQHWHCLGDAYADSANGPADKPLWYTTLHGKPAHTSHEAVDSIFPCWACPGIQMPPSSPRKNSCMAGTLQTVEQNWALKMAFRWPWINASICCADPANCDKLPIPTLPYCRTVGDLDCVIWEFVSPHHYY